jgi:hypothetical protein
MNRPYWSGDSVDPASRRHEGCDEASDAAVPRIFGVWINCAGAQKSHPVPLSGGSRQQAVIVAVAVYVVAVAVEVEAYAARDRTRNQ